MANKDVEAKKMLDDFFQHIKELSKWFEHWTSEPPKELVINPDIIAELSRVEGFYQRDELGTEVSAHAPIIRYFKLDFGVVLLVEDYEEKFLHFE